MKLQEAIEVAVSKNDGHHARLATETLQFKRGYNYKQVFETFKKIATQLGISYDRHDHEELMVLADEDSSNG